MNHSTHVLLNCDYNFLWMKWRSRSMSWCQPSSRSFPIVMQNPFLVMNDNWMIKMASWRGRVNNNEHTFNQLSLYHSINSCSTHLSIFWTFLIAERCRNIVDWLTFILTASSFVVSFGFIFIHDCKTFFIDNLGLPRRSFCSDKSTKWNFFDEMLHIFRLQYPPKILDLCCVWFLQPYCRLFEHV